MKGKEIKFEDIKNSPYTTAVILVLIILLVIAGIAFLIYDIVQTKQEIVEVRASYQENLKEIAILEELRAQSEKAEAQLAEAAAAARASTSEGLCQLAARVQFVLPRLTDRPTVV